jgi:ankyrin repeat protein
MTVRALVVALLLAVGLSVAQTPGEGLLFLAIRKADTAAAKRLLDQGVRADSKDSEGTPALMAATLYSSADLVKLLLDRGANPNVTNAAGATPLMWAIPDLAKVKMLLEHGADANAKSKSQRTPLLVAASYPGSVEVLKLLLSKGADLHAKDGLRMHALGRAVVSSDVSVVRFLVESGIDPNEEGYGNLTRLYARHYLPSIEYLQSKGLKMSPDILWAAVHWHPPTLLEKWITMGANVNAQTGRYQRSALMTAAASEQSTPATLKTLLEKGADPNAEDSEGERPLDWAIYRADQGKIDVLRQFGAMRGKGPRQETYPGPEPEGIADARTSLSRAVGLLLPTAPVVFKQPTRCATCHSQSLVEQAAAVARAKGVTVNEQLAAENLSQILSFMKPASEEAMQGEQPAGNFIAVGYAMSGLAAEPYPLDNITAAFTHLVAGLQMPDGSWLGNGVSRPPLEDSIVSQTALAVRALTLYPIAGQTKELDEKLRRAQRWLLTAPATSAEERNMRLMGLVWTKASREDINAAMRQVLSQQAPDGGWPQRDHDATDAYATGMSLFALHEAGTSVTSDVYRKGVAFLLRNQYQNGAWFVKTRAYPVQAYFESGYPFGRNQWISAAGAAWASLAIANTLPDAAPGRLDRR